MKKKNIKFNILLIVTLISLALLITPKVFQNDTFYTIKVGEKIMKNGVDMQEHFTWHEGLNYTYPHWLYDVFIYLIYNFFGFTGIYISTIILVFILVTIMYKTTNSIIKDRGISYILVLILSLTLRTFMAARAQLVSYILLLLIIYFIEKLRETNKKKYIVFIFLSALLIANLHSAVWPMIFILFLPFLTSDLVYFIKNKYKDKINKYKEKYALYDNRIEVEKCKNTKPLVITFLITIITGFLTPNFLLPFTYLIKSKMGITMNYISEHQATTISDKPSLFIILGLIIFLLLQAKMKIKLRDLFFIAGLTLLAFLSQRSYAFFAIFLIYTLGRLLKKFISARTKIKIEDILTNTTIYVVLIILITSTTFTFFKYEIQKNYVNEKKYPTELSNFILENLDVESIRIYNEYNFGSYLLFRNIPVFIDSRADVYDDQFNKNSEVFNDNVKIFDNYEEIFKKYKITHVVIYNTNKLKKVLDLDNNYKVIYKDKYFSMYENLSN